MHKFTKRFMKLFVINLVLAAAVVVITLAIRQDGRTEKCNKDAVITMKDMIAAMEAFHADHGYYTADPVELSNYQALDDISEGVAGDYWVMSVHGDEYYLETRSGCGDRTYRYEGPNGKIKEKP
jgi:hypothetical protein